MTSEKITEVLDSLKTGNDPENVHNQIIDKCKDALLKEDENAGWIRIEADGSNLPIVDIYQKFEVGKLIDNIFDSGKNCDAEELFNGFQRGHITHYKPIEKSKPPIF